MCGYSLVTPSYIRRCLLVTSLFCVCLLGACACLEVQGQNAPNPDTKNLDTAEEQSSARVQILDIESTEFRIPPAEEIDRIVVELYDSPANLPDVPQFDVPKSAFGEVIACLRPYAVDPSPVLTYREIGTMRIFAKDGSSRRVSWYWQGKAGLKFSLQGVRYYHSTDSRRPVDEGMLLEGVLRTAFFESTGLDATTVRTSKKP